MNHERHEKHENKGEGLMPRLRFPEFREAGEWKEKSLGDCLDYIQPTKYLVTSTDYDDKYPTPVLTAGKTFVLGYTNETNGIFNKDLPVIIFDDFTTASKFVDFPFKGKSSAMKILLAKKGVDIKFIYEAMQLIRYEVGVHERHWISIFSKLSVSVPTHFEEQQKIADCLSSLDAMIAAQVDKIDALKIHKKGLMQQLFPREGETVPRLRFPKFRDAGEWRKCKLEEMAKRGSGHTPNKKYPSYYNGGIKWVSLADSDKLDGGYIFKTKHEISKEGLKNSSAVLHPAETVVLSRDAGVGKSAVLQSPMAVSQHFIAWRCDNSILNNWFFYYLLQRLKPELESIAVGNTIKTIGLSYFKSMIVMVPSLSEQREIASCLSSLDALITAHSEKLEVLKIHKKGLMQKLFPLLEPME